MWRGYAGVTLSGINNIILLEFNITKQFEIERDNGAALAFDGELIAKVSSSDNNEN